MKLFYMASLSDPHDRWHFRHGDRQDFDLIPHVSTWPKPTRNQDGKQTSEPPGSIQHSSDDLECSIRKTAKSLDRNGGHNHDNTELKSCINAEEVASSPKESSVLTHNLPDSPACSTHNENMTRGVTDMLPNPPSPPSNWAPNVPSPTGNLSISAHSGSHIETVTGDARMDHPVIAFAALGQTLSMRVGLADTDNQITTSSRVLWQRIQRLRLEIWTLRSELHEARARLREYQNAKALAEDALIQYIRKGLLLSLDAEGPPLYQNNLALQKLIDDSQAARDEYGPLEDDCNLIEDRLSGHEFRLARMEEEYYNRPGGHPSSAPGTPALSYDGNTPPLGAAKQSQTPTREELENLKYHPRVELLLSNLGQLDLLYDRLEDLLEDKEEVDEEKRTRELSSRVLEQHDQTFLDNFQAHEKELRNAITDLEARITVMREECLLHGLIDRNDEPTDLRSQEKGYFTDDEDINPRENISEYVKYPFLLPRVGVSRKEAHGPYLNENSDDALIRVNQWLLDRLRTSALDVRLLASTFEGWVGETTDGWEILVLDVWYKDGTTKLPSFRFYNSSLSTHAPPRSNSSCLSPLSSSLQQIASPTLLEVQ
ncbi:hypothetical protein B0J14DRAFT_153540 [Halenospora varia]|nr:hypothetical protein B0J14DRAFT_153540 [Halenospora varia]